MSWVDDIAMSKAESFPSGVFWEAGGGQQQGRVIGIFSCTIIHLRYPQGGDTLTILRFMTLSNCTFASFHSALVILRPFPLHQRLTGF